MSTGLPRRRRHDLATALNLPPGHFVRWYRTLKQGDVLVRLVICSLVAIVMWFTTASWRPPFRYHVGATPQRGIVARTSFSVEDPEETSKRQRQARAQTLCLYQHDRTPLVQLRQALKGVVFQLVSVAKYEDLTVEQRAQWSGFFPAVAPVDGIAPPPHDYAAKFEQFRAALAEDLELVQFDRALQSYFAEFEMNGLIDGLAHSLEDGNQSAILVHDVGNLATAHRVEIEGLRITRAINNIRPQLLKSFSEVTIPSAHRDVLAQLVSTWILAKRLPVTLTLNQDASESAREDAAAKVEIATRQYKVGSMLVTGGQPLSASEVLLLRKEYEAHLAQMTWPQRVGHALASFGMYIALFTLCGAYILVHHPMLVMNLRRLVTLLMTVMITVTVCAVDIRHDWQLSVIPMVMFGATISIAYQRELALLLTAVTALIVSLTTGQGLPEYVILVASAAAAVLLLGRVRSRTKLIYVGLSAGAVAFFTTVGIGTLVGQTYGWSGLGSSPVLELDEWFQEFFHLRLVFGALWFGACAVIAGVLMTGMLPFVERAFQVQTDISLLELGDAAHPLLQELVRRAPGTYNHSLAVASLAEKAAEAIGANGLLTRVGAYFHDIGKIFKPDYFIENQSAGANKHDTLVPAMSTLVITAHVKDGADLARQHGLPQSVIDFIEQHHGTTLVEYFFRQATRQQEGNPDGMRVDEADFRYPGPKPQTKEAAVLMIADACESACRTLTDPAASRIEHLVHELAMKRLTQGQFSECGLTFQELQTIEDTLVKSLIAVYHARVKYSDERSA